MNTISIISFIVATGAVAFFTVRIVRGMKKSDNATCKVIDLPFYDEDKLLPGDLLNLNVK
jgi:hypothetical protein